MPRKPKEVNSPQRLVPAEDKAGEKAAFSSEAYNKVARAAKLQAILLTESRFKVSPDFFVARQKGEEPNLRYSSAIATVMFDDEAGIASCEWKWAVVGKTKGKKTLSIEAVYFILYDDLIGCDAEAAKRFLRRVGRFASYPYFRAHVSQTSWESGANLPILPTIST